MDSHGFRHGESFLWPKPKTVRNYAIIYKTFLNTAASPAGLDLRYTEITHNRNEAQDLKL